MLCYLLLEGFFQFGSAPCFMKSFTGYKTVALEIVLLSGQVLVISFLWKEPPVYAVRHALQ